MSEKYKSIAVTNFINPHLFWYYENYVPNKDYAEVIDMEKELGEIVQENEQKPTIGKMVAVRYLPWGKLIRASVDHVETVSKIIMWAIDYGFPFRTTCDHIFKLPQRYTRPIDRVHLGGLANAFPAEKAFELKLRRLEINKTTKWSNHACETMEKLLKEAETIEVMETYTISNHSWVELRLTTHLGEKFSVRNYLIDQGLAIDTGENFKEICCQLETTNVLRWMTNEGHNKFKPNKAIMETNRKVEEWFARNKQIRQTFHEYDQQWQAPFDNGAKIYDHEHLTAADDLTKDMSSSSTSGCRNLKVAIKEAEHQKRLNHANLKDAQNKLDYSWALRGKSSSQGSRVAPPRLQRSMNDRKKRDTETLTGEPKAETATQDYSWALRGKSSSQGSRVAPPRLQRSMNDRKKRDTETLTGEPKAETATQDYSWALRGKSSSQGSRVAPPRLQRSMNDRKKRDTETLTGEPKAETATQDYSWALRGKSSSQGSRVAPPRLQRSMNDRKKRDTETLTGEPKAETATQDYSWALRGKSSSQGSRVAPPRLQRSMNDRKKRDTETLTGEPKAETATQDYSWALRGKSSSQGSRVAPPRLQRSMNDRKKRDTETLTGEPKAETATQDYSWALRGKSSSQGSRVAPPRLQRSMNDRKKRDTETLTGEPKAETATQVMLSSGFSMVFSGHGLSNLKKSNNDHVPHDGEKSIRDTSITTLKGEPISSTIAIIDNTIDLRKENFTSNKDSQNPFRRDKLNSPSTQINKSHENKNGNIDIVVVGNQNSSGTKLDPHTSTIRSVSEYNELATNDNLSDGSSNFQDSLNPSSYKIKLPRLEELRKIEGECIIKTQFIDNLVLAHSRLTSEMIEMISEASFCREISDKIRKMGITKLYRLQAYSWPHLLRRNSVFIVNPSRSGKTWSYLPAICNNVCNYSYPNSYGPMCLILVPSFSHVEEISNYCKSLLLNVRPQVTTVASFGVRNANEVKIGLLNSCGVLIATPTSFLRLLEDNQKESLIDFKRLRHLVIDDMDLIIKRSQNEFKTVVRTLFKMCRHVKARNKLALNIQLVVTSCDWDSTMLAMLRKSSHPLLLIGDFLEAATYGKVAISISLCQSENKINTIIQFIERNSLASKRLLILCDSDDDVSQVTMALKASNHICIGCSSKTSVEELAIANELKKEKIVSSGILVCTDAIFSQLQIQNFRCVVHYTMPTSWTKFTTRFGALTQTYENHVKNNFEIATSPIEENSKSLILLDEENSIQLPRLMDFMKKHNQLKFVHKDILTSSERVLLAREEKRLHQRVGLCPYLLEFGECDEMRCDYRHNLNNIDVSPKDEIPGNGDIRILVLKVFSPIHYSARLLQHRRTGSSEWRDIRLANEMCKFGMQMNLHYSNRENLILHWPLRIGDLCVYNTSQNFHRAIILEVPEIRNFGLIKIVRLTLKLIDRGIILPNVKSDEVFVCHEKFKQFPSQAIDIRLLGVVPLDNERAWDGRATKSVQNWLINEIKTDECVYASIDFALANTIWVNNIIVMESLPTTGHYICCINVKQLLVRKNIAAIVGTKHSKIKNIVEESGLLVSNKESEIELASGCGIEIKKDENFILPKSEDLETEPFTMREIENNKNDVEDCDKSLMDNSNKNKKIDVPIPKLVEKQDIKDGSNFARNDIKEDWIKLPLCELVKVEIGDENDNGSWNDIFLQCIEDGYMTKFLKLLELTKAHISILCDNPFSPFPASWFKPMQNCIVRYENCFLRAKFFNIFDCSNKSSPVYRFFLCDYACFVIAKEEELYDNFLYPTSKEIVEFMPYQAVHCTLAGINLVRFAKQYKVTKDFLFAYAVSEKEDDSRNTLKLKINSFEIILFENESENDLTTMKMVNTALVQNAAASLDYNTQHYLDLDIGFVRKEIQNDYDLCNFEGFINTVQRALELESEEKQPATADEQEKLREVLKETKAICSTPEKHTPAPKDRHKTLTTVTKEEILPQVKKEKRANEELLCSVSSSQYEHLLDNPREAGPVSRLPPLKLLWKSPKTTWCDTDYLIYLTIHAPDIKDYHLEVSANTLLFAAKAPEEDYVLVLNFLHFVEPQMVSHELRGLNVIVKLVKSVSMVWQRLLKQTTKYPWLQYNLNAIRIERTEHILPQQQLHSILLGNEQFMPNINCSGSEESDDEKQFFQTFTPIVNNEDVHDPTEEMF